MSLPALGSRPSSLTSLHSLPTNQDRIRRAVQSTRRTSGTRTPTNENKAESRLGPPQLRIREVRELMLAIDVTRSRGGVYGHDKRDHGGAHITMWNRVELIRDERQGAHRAAPVRWSIVDTFCGILVSCRSPAYPRPFHPVMCTTGAMFALKEQSTNSSVLCMSVLLLPSRAAPTSLYSTFMVSNSKPIISNVETPQTLQ